MSRVLSFRCRGCGEKVEVEEQYAGRTVSCPFCAKRAKVVIPTGNGKASAPSGQIKFACGSCGQKHFAEATRAGEKVKCEACGTRLRIPGAPLPASHSGPVPLPPETSPAPAARRPSKPSRPPEPTPDEAPPSLDVYGFGDAGAASEGSGSAPE